MGWLSTNIFGADNSRYAMASVPVIFGFGPLALIARAARPLRTRMGRVGAAAR